MTEARVIPVKLEQGCSLVLPLSGRGAGGAVGRLRQDELPVEPEKQSAVSCRWRQKWV